MQVPLALDVSVIDRGDEDLALTVTGTEGLPTPLPYQRELCVFLSKKGPDSKNSVSSAFLFQCQENNGRKC